MNYRNCANGELHGYPPDGSPEYEVGTVYFWCPVTFRHWCRDDCRFFKEGEPKKFDKKGRAME